MPLDTQKFTYIRLEDRSVLRGYIASLASPQAGQWLEPAFTFFKTLPHADKKTLDYNVNKRAMLRKRY